MKTMQGKQANAAVPTRAGRAERTTVKDRFDFELPCAALPDPKESRRKVRGWLLRTHPEERSMIGDFDGGVTFAEVNRRMHAGEDFYGATGCGESEQRIHVFGEMARIYGKPYAYWHDLWLAAHREETEKLMKRIGLGRIRRILGGRSGNARKGRMG